VTRFRAGEQRNELLPIPSHDTHLRCRAFSVFKLLSAAKWQPKNINIKKISNKGGSQTIRERKP
jgi:hypothetical protein